MPDQLINNAMPTIFIADMDRAVEFYTQTLGLKLSFRADNHFAIIDTGSETYIGLHPASPDSPTPGTHGSIQLSFGVTSIDDAVAALTDKGVQFAGPIIDDGPVRLAYFTDPDGTDLFLCQSSTG